MSATPRALALLLDLLDSKALLYTHATLTDFHGDAGNEVIRSGLVAQVGFELASTAEDDDGRPVHLSVHDHSGRLGYDSPSQGRIHVEKSETTLYAPKPEVVAKLLLGKHLQPAFSGSGQLDSGGFIWNVGSIRLQGNRWSSAWIARRLADRAVVDILRAENSARPSPGGRLVLTSTPRRRTAQLSIPGVVIVSIADVLSNLNGAAIDIEVLRTRFRGEPLDVIEWPLHLSTDDRLLVINGGEAKLRLTGTKQRRIARLVVDAHKSGRPIDAAEILTRQKRCRFI